MQYRELGRTGLMLSEIGFGCGSVGGLMVRGERPDQLQAVELALRGGINYFDTAPSYGDGRSEANLGPVLQELRADVHVGTKVEIRSEDFGDIPGAIEHSLDASLGRLQREYVDLLQLHTRIADERRPERNLLGADDVLGEVVSTFERLRDAGKLRFFGITGMGETTALHRVVGAGSIYSVQSVYNLLNPSAGLPVPPGFFGQDFGQFFPKAAERGIGVIAIRALAAGALSGSADRHRVASASTAPMASSASFAEDVEKAQQLRFLVDGGITEDLVEASLRFVLANDEVSTVLVGISSREQVEAALIAEAQGPLPPVAFTRVVDLWSQWTD
jgi:L-galactose dehydrogenase/L-glyceraldehyde 3-phosphate reductase